MAKIGLSKRRRLPVLKLYGATFPLWDYRRVRAIEKTGLKLDTWGVCALEELLKVGNLYLPPFTLDDKTVLDIGACCGETAWFFLKHGASKAVCIESDPERVKLINENRKNLGLNIEVLPGEFQLEHLLVPHDFIKCDIEGGEALLLDADLPKLKPCVLEVHSRALKEKFQRRGFRALTQPNPNGVCLMVNYSP